MSARILEVVEQQVQIDDVCAAAVELGIPIVRVRESGSVRLVEDAPSTRDLFAAAALAGMLAYCDRGEHVVAKAFELADAMLRERGRKTVSTASVEHEPMHSTPQPERDQM